MHCTRQHRAPPSHRLVSSSPANLKLIFTYYKTIYSVTYNNAVLVGTRAAILGAILWRHVTQPTNHFNAST